MSLSTVEPLNADTLTESRTHKDISLFCEGLKSVGSKVRSIQAGNLVGSLSRDIDNIAHKPEVFCQCILKQMKLRCCYILHNS